MWVLEITGSPVSCDVVVHSADGKARASETTTVRAKQLITVLRTREQQTIDKNAADLWFETWNYLDGDIPGDTLKTTPIYQIMTHISNT
jgi:hypothetical protein